MARTISVRFPKTNYLEIRRYRKSKQQQKWQISKVEIFKYTGFFGVFFVLSVDIMLFMNNKQIIFLVWKIMML